MVVIVAGDGGVDVGDGGVGLDVHYPINVVAVRFLNTAPGTRIGVRIRVRKRLDWNEVRFTGQCTRTDATERHAYRLITGWYFGFSCTPTGVTPSLPPGS